MQDQSTTVLAVTLYCLLVTAVYADVTTRPQGVTVDAPRAGSIEGFRVDPGSPVIHFYGIPYAKPPTRMHLPHHTI